MKEGGEEEGVGEGGKETEGESKLIQTILSIHFYQILIYGQPLDPPQVCT